MIFTILALCMCGGMMQHAPCCLVASAPTSTRN